MSVDKCIDIVSLNMPYMCISLLSSKQRCLYDSDDVWDDWVEFDRTKWCTTTHFPPLYFQRQRQDETAVSPLCFINVPQQSYCILLELLTSLPNGPLLKTDHLY